MKRRDFLLTPAAVTTALAATSTVDSPVLARPRLYYDRQRIQQLRVRLASDVEFLQMWQKLLQHADRLVDADLVLESAAERGSGDDANFGRPSQQIIDMAFTLGLAYHVTEREQYAQKLQNALLHFAGYDTWHGPGFAKRVPPWHSELNTARFCVGVGVAYDAIYPLLSATGRKVISDSLIQKGILATCQDWLSPGTRIHALDSMGHNWWAVCISSLGVAALSLAGDDERVPGWLESVNEAIAEWFSFGGNVLQNKSLTFDSGGGFYESVGYANYALSEYLRYRLAYSNVFPNRKLPNFPALANSFNFFLHTFYPGSQANLSVNFGDSSTSLQVPRTIRLLIQTGFSHKAAGWYLSKTTSTSVPPDAADFLAGQTAPAPMVPQLPTSVIFSDIGWAILRDSWDDDATMLAVKSGFTWNHAHADAGSFILFHKGVPLLVDSGTCGYGNPEYGRYYVQSFAHNVILFDREGEPQEDHLRGVKFPGQLHGLLDHLGVKYVFADATGPMADNLSRNYRHWLWMDGVILVFDDLLAHREGKFDWLLHYNGSATQSGNDLEIVNKQARAQIRFIYPETLDVREEQGLADHQPDKKIPFYALRTRESARVQKFITAIIPYAGDSPRELPQIQPLPAADALGVSVQTSKTVTDVYLNLQADGRRMHLNSNNSIAGWETDAYLVAWTRTTTTLDNPAGVNRLFVACGSYLRKQRRSYLECLSKVSAVWQPGNSEGAKIIGQKDKKVFLQ